MRRYLALGFSFLATAAFLAVGCQGGSLKSISLTPNPATLAAGENLQLIANGTFSDDSQLDVTSMLEFSSSNPSVANPDSGVGSEGLIHALANGSAVITAKDPVTGTTATVQITVTSAVLTALSLSDAT